MIKRISILSAMLSLALFSCAQKKSEKSVTSLTQNQLINLDTATFAGGCFWCVEASFDQIEGVIEAVSGYAGGSAASATYKKVSSGQTDHTETVQIYYDPKIINYETLLDIFFTAHDPTQLNRQGPDVGTQYRSAIFYHSPAQKTMAEQKMIALNKEVFNGNIVTELNGFEAFYLAEDYHQDYERKNPNDRYVQTVSMPKIKKVRKKFSDRVKEEYKQG